MPENDSLLALQQWYKTRCDGNWEHQYGITIETLDNPGWKLKIHLTGTGLEKESFEEVRADTSADEECWLRCWVDRQSNTFEAACGPSMLSEAVRIFIVWANP